MFNRATLLSLILLFAHGVAHAGGLDVYFVRHAQTLSNAKGVHNTRNSSTFTGVGMQQVEVLTEALKGYQFDDVLVSPTERTLNTIQPYLRDTGKRAEVWPEITECCWQSDRGDLSGGQVTWDREMRIPSEFADQFIFRDRNSMQLCGNRNYADGVAQVRRAADLIRKRFGNSGKTILVVAHYHSGQVLLGELLGVERDTLPGLENARISHLSQNTDGSFTLRSINVVPE